MVEEQSRYIFFRVRQLFHKKLKPLRGPDLQTRLRSYSRDVLTFLGAMTYESAKLNAKKLFTTYLALWSWKMNIADKLRHSAIQFEYLMHRAHIMHEILQSQRHTLFDEIWTQQ